MFSYLIDSVFPYCGEFFGKLSAIANLSLGEFYNLLSWSNQTSLLPPNWQSLDYLQYKNMFTGVTTAFIPFYELPTLITQPFKWITRLMFIGIPSSVPLWVALLISCVELYIVYAMIKFIVSLI